MTAPRVTSAVGELATTDGLARLCRRIDALIAWKIAQERRSASRFHQRRRQVRRRRQQRADRRRALLSTLTRAWRR